jgi:hypothetical protein
MSLFLDNEAPGVQCSMPPYRYPGTLTTKPRGDFAVDRSANDSSSSGRARARDVRISYPSIPTAPLIACFSLCGNRIDYFGPPTGTGQFRSVPRSLAVNKR